MNNPNLARTLAGISITSLGVLAALGSLNVINFKELFSLYWPSALLLTGLLLFLASRKNLLWAFVIILAGFGFLLRNLGYTDLNVFSLFWPAIIIILGVSLIRQSRHRPATSTGDDNYFTIMSGAESRNTSKNYSGGKITALMGGVELDLREANIKKSATLEVFVVMGGVDIRVPRGWVVRSQAMALLGGIDNKADTNTKDDAPVLTIVGTVALGGVEVKY